MNTEKYTSCSLLECGQLCHGARTIGTGSAGLSHRYQYHADLYRTNQVAGARFPRGVNSIRSNWLPPSMVVIIPTTPNVR